MGLFDIFKKKEKLDYDPLNVKITDLQKGFILEYDLKTWIVSEVYKYDWGDNFFTSEFKVDCENDSLFIHLEQDDELEITLSKKVKIRSIDEDLPEHIIKNEHPPKKLTYNGKQYFKDKESPGYFKNITMNTGWTEFISWDYYSEDEKEIITIEQWGEREFEASIGRVAKEFEFSNILPAQD